MAPTATTDVDTDDLSGLHIKDDWKAEGMYALFDGERLITRSANRSSLERAKSRIEDQIKAGGGRPFSSRVAPVETRPDADDVDDGPPRRTKRASWAE